jgi:hypothetical protein
MGPAKSLDRVCAHTLGPHALGLSYELTDARPTPVDLE